MCSPIAFNATPVSIFQISCLYSEFSITKILCPSTVNVPVKIPCVRLIEIYLTSSAEPVTKQDPVSVLTSTVKEKLHIGQNVGSMLKLPSMDELLTLIPKLMNIVIRSTIHLSYLKVTDYFTEIMCLGLQMKTTQDHSLFSRQIKFQTLLL